MCKKQATNLSLATSMSGGSFFLQISMACGHLVLNLHPGGGLIALGTSPFMATLMRLAVGSGTGTAAISASV